MVTILSSFLSSEQPDDPRPRLRQLADRKVTRFLEGPATAPFLAALEAYKRSGLSDPSEIALFTVSEWEPSVPEPPTPTDGRSDSQAWLARHYQENGNPSEWLRAMPNNALCQMAIAARFRGPNAHLVGWAPALRFAFLMAEQAMDRGAASAAVVVAYDVVGPMLHPAVDVTTTLAAAVVVGPDRGPRLELDHTMFDGSATARSALDRIAAASVAARGLATATTAPTRGHGS